MYSDVSSTGNAAFSKSAYNNKLILNFVVTMFKKKVILIMLSLCDKFKRDNF